MSIALDRESSLFLGVVTLEEPGVLRAVDEVLQLLTSLFFSASHLRYCKGKNYVSYYYILYSFWESV